MENKLKFEEFQEIFEGILNSVHSLDASEQFEGENFAAGDDVDQYGLERDRQLDLRLKGRNSVYLKKIKDALARIKEGTFGECEECGCQISKSRLLARPTATMCLGCKEQQESDDNKMANKNRYSTRFDKNDQVLKFKTIDDASAAIKNEFSESA
jgi:DnaK suppressor protein